MKLFDALQIKVGAEKHVDEPVAGMYTVSKANLSAGYYEDFQPDDPERRTPVCTSYLWQRCFPGDSDPLTKIADFAGEDGWEPYGLPR